MNQARPDAQCLDGRSSPTKASSRQPATIVRGGQEARGRRLEDASRRMARSWTIAGTIAALFGGSVPVRLAAGRLRSQSLTRRYGFWAVPVGCEQSRAAEGLRGSPPRDAPARRGQPPRRPEHDAGDPDRRRRGGQSDRRASSSESSPRPVSVVISPLSVPRPLGTDGQQGLRVGRHRDRDPP